MRLAIDIGTSITSGAVVQGEIPHLLEDTTSISFDITPLSLSEGEKEKRSIKVFQQHDRENKIANGRFIPSYVYASKAKGFALGFDAENQRLKDAKRFQREFKRDLGSDKPYFLGEYEVLPQEIMVMLIEKMKLEAEKVTGEPGNRLILSVPATYQDYKKNLMLWAGNKAGFREVYLVPEPVAAAIYYAQRSSTSDGEILLVYDLGGGTFDASIIQRYGSGYKFLGTPTGIERCGGVDFDRAIFEGFKKQCSPDGLAWLNSPHALRDRLFLAEECRKLKEQLSFEDEGFLEFTLGSSLVESDEYHLKRTDFERMITPYIEQTIQECHRLLSAPEMAGKQVDRILLVGGSTQIPYIKQRLEEEFKIEVFRSDDPELAVCRGAAVYEEWNPGYTYLQAGIDLEDIGDYEKAIQNVNRALRESPNYARAYTLRSVVYDQLGNYNQADEDARKAIQIDPKYADARIASASVHFSKGEYNKAAEEYIQALKLNPNSLGAYYDLGRSLLGEDKLKALATWKEALQVTPQTADDYCMRGLILESLRDYESALNAHNQAILLNRRLVNAYVGRAQVHAFRKDFQSALGDYDQALKLNSRSANIYGWRAGLYLEHIQDFRKAIEDCNSALKLNPSYAIIYHNRGSARLNLEENQAALEDFKQAQRLSPNFSGAWNGAGWAYLAMENYQLALDNFNKAIRISRNEADHYVGRGYTYLALEKNYEKGLQDFNQAIRLDAECYSAYHGRAMVHIKSGSNDSAVQDLQSAARLAKVLGHTNYYELIQNDLRNL